MDRKLKAEWVKALRSGEFEQAFYSTGYDKTCCVIGVGAVVAGLDVGRSITSTCATALGLTQDEVNELTNLNDNERMPFPKLADYIEANL
jgi:hypothetical protein